MNTNQINKLASLGKLPGNDKHVELKETNISWVILFSELAYKIKRPVKYSFVDFSSLEKRYYYCQQEMTLNKRLAPEMYLDIIPITGSMAGETNNKSQIIDYAVQMKRMDNNKAMNLLLSLNKVTPFNAERLARVLAEFHDHIEIIHKTFDISEFQSLYADLDSVTPFTAKKAGNHYAALIKKCIHLSDTFLSKHTDVFDDRVQQGYCRNCHGDFNAFNIFLYDDPVVFDCVEFNEAFRHIDVLNELAFLCVDLDFFDQHTLSELFTQKYFEFSKQNTPPIITNLLAYYKSYRANIRAKVNLIAARDSTHTDNNHQIEDAAKYLDLMHKYINEAISDESPRVWADKYHH